MKKYFLLAFCAVLLFGVAGCSNKNKVVCTKTTTEDGQSVTEEGVFELDKDNKVTSASGSFTFNDEELAKSYCELFKMGFGEEASNIVECSGKKIIIKDLEKLDEDEEEDSTKIVGLTKDELIELETAEGYSCK